MSKLSGLDRSVSEKSGRIVKNSGSRSIPDKLTFSKWKRLFIWLTDHVAQLWRSRRRNLCAYPQGSMHRFIFRVYKEVESCLLSFFSAPFLAYYVCPCFVVVVVALKSPISRCAFLRGTNCRVAPAFQPSPQLLRLRDAYFALLCLTCLSLFSLSCWSHADASQDRRVVQKIWLISDFWDVLHNLVSPLAFALNVWKRICHGLITCDHWVNIRENRLVTSCK